MGVDVVVHGASAEELERIEWLFEGWERVFSRFRPDSELNRVNRSESSAVVVSELFARAVSTALAAARSTGGLVDPTLGLAIEAAGYDTDFSLLPEDDDERPPGPPSPGRWPALRLDGRLLARPPGLHLDLNGVVKSLAVDASLERLEGDGFVAAGGDVAARGAVAVGLPGGGSLRLRSGGLATSGITVRHWHRGDRLKHHLIDPRSGRPSTSRWDEVTVAAGSCLAADVAAKAAFLLGDDGPGWLDDRGLPGRFLEQGELLANDRWRASVEPEAAVA
jgi:thiamine biosynthesis lipoprotein